MVKPKAASTQQPDEPAAKRLRLEAGDAGGSAAAQAGAAADKAKPAGELASLLGGYASASAQEQSAGEAETEDGDGDGSSDDDESDDD